ncbi:MAG: prolipoprotein diacylglyceryl transferase [Planctomycetes bacterium]|nr:prolipoprotein diacylglyceryl transferase [Planctomycetota bacterium]
MIGYGLCVALGIALALWAARAQRQRSGLPERTRAVLLYAACAGAILGAYLLQLPADLLGWAWQPEGQRGDALPLGGRTVLGGLLGGWLAVELAKQGLGWRKPTGDGFALPLAIALAFGRVGCAFAGCCAGEVCEPAWWALRDAEGLPRIPVQLVEALFHAGFALLFWALRASALLADRRLALYLALYAALRFALEFARENPPISLGLSYYQFLALALFALAGVTFVRRSRGLPPSPLHA